MLLVQVDQGKSRSIHARWTTRNLELVVIYEGGWCGVLSTMAFWTVLWTWSKQQ